MTHPATASRAQVVSERAALPTCRCGTTVREGHYLYGVELERPGIPHVRCQACFDLYKGYPTLNTHTVVFVVSGELTATELNQLWRSRKPVTLNPIPEDP